MALRLNGLTSGYVELAAPAVAGTTVLTLPTDSIQPGLVLIAKADASSVNSVSINNCFTSAYTNYRIVFSGSSNSTGSGLPSLRLRFRAGGVDNSAAVYYGNVMYSTYAAGPSRSYDTAMTSATFTWLGDYGILGTMDISFPATATYKMMSSQGQMTGTAANIYGVIGYGYLGATAFDGFSLIADSSQLIGGTVRVYGYRNSITS